MVSESEVGQLAREMGVDEGRLRNILAGGTGTIQSREIVSKGYGWPGNEEFERVISGELSPVDLEEIADLAGGRYEDKGVPGVREAREFWEGFRYVTVNISSREGRTRVLAKSKISVQRLAPFFPFLIFIPIIALKMATKGNPGDLESVIQGIIAMGALIYFGVGWGMRTSRKRIQEKIDSVAEAVQEHIRQNRSFGSTSTQFEVRDEIEQQSVILGDDGG